jgi:hypothetical protein
MVEKKHLSAIEQALLDLLANNLFGCGRSVSACADEWDYIWHEAYVQAVPLNIFANGVSGDVPQEMAAHIKSKIGEIVLSVSRRIGEHTFIHRLLTEAGIDYTIIKGFACSLYYPDPLIRWLGDVDFLVDPCDEEKTVKVLLDKGFTEISTIGESHRVFSYKGCRYELHTEPAGIPSGELGEVVKEHLSNTVQKSKLQTTIFGQVRVPDKFHHGLIMLLHMSHHLNGEGIGLRHLCDWAVYVSTIGVEGFKELFEKPLKEMGLWHFALVLTKVCSKYLGCGVSFVDDRDLEKVSDDLLFDLFEGGNLGQKSDNRAHEALVLSENPDNSYIKNLFESANRIVYKNWGFCRKVKILLPVGWAFFGIRYAFRSLKGERLHIDLKEIKEEAVKRKDLYSRLQIFIKEDK